MIFDFNPTIFGIYFCAPFEKGKVNVGVGTYYFEESLDEERPGTSEGGTKQ
jgi:hypothetical protein